MIYLDGESVMQLVINLYSHGYNTDLDPLNPAILSILSTIKSKHCINLTDEKLIEQVIKTKHVSHNRTQVHNLMSHETILAEIVVNRSSIVFY